MGISLLIRSLSRSILVALVAMGARSGFLCVLLLGFAWLFLQGESCVYVFVCLFVCLSSHIEPLFNHTHTRTKKAPSTLFDLGLETV